jgi:hypothetical protein
MTWLAIAALFVGLLVPFVNPTAVDAAQVTVRSIEMESSEANVENDYVITFTVPDTGTQNIGSFRVEFCNNDPLPGTTCTNTAVGDDVPQVDALAGNIATLSGSPSFDGEAISLTAPSNGHRHLDFTLASATDITADEVFSVTVLDIDNPSNTTDTDNNNTFYARLYTYASTTPTAIANPVTGYNNEGGVAMSTAQIITIDARVQEILDFCVGTVITTTGDCSTVSGNSIDLGVLDQTQVTESATLDQTGGTAGCDFDDTDECAVMVVTTNATADGVAIDYRAQGFDVGSTCPTGTTAAGSVTDQCLNPVNESAETSLAVASEDWGIAVINSTAHASSTTTNLTRANDVIEAYDHDASGYAVDDGDTSIALAQSDLTGDNTPASRVVDREQLEVEIAASPAYTTPSGSYQTTLEFIATGTF